MVINKRLVRVYVAGPLSDGAVGYIKNVNKMIREALKIHKVGASPFVPALDFLMGMYAGNWDYKDYFSMSEPWLRVSDSVYAYELSYSETKGVQNEIKIAKEMGIPVFRTFGGWSNWYLDFILKNELLSKEEFRWVKEEVEKILKETKKESI